ncbi:hypothetical protein JW906_03445 [bacterium]|nr:hypothetical protein [bacterium]
MLLIRAPGNLLAYAATMAATIAALSGPVTAILAGKKAMMICMTSARNTKTKNTPTKAHTQTARRLSPMFGILICFLAYGDMDPALNSMLDSIRVYKWFYKYLF